MDAEMLYHKDAVFWLTNFKQKSVLGVCVIIIILRDVSSQPNTDQSIG